MAGEYFDAVFDKDTNMLFNGLPEDAVKWLEDRPSDQPLWVHVGETAQILTASEYVDLADKVLTIDSLKIGSEKVDPRGLTYGKIDSPKASGALECGHVTDCWCGRCHICEDVTQDC